MALKLATEIFSQWALNGRDIGMEANHAPAVNAMLDEVIGYRSSPFSIIDAGCGNGWVVRKIIEDPLCKNAIGVDGAKNMIEKARSLHAEGNYYHADLLDWRPDEKVDIVHAMEVLYYFKNPEKLILHILDNWLEKNGTIIIGMDHYFENPKSHSWPADLNTYMKLLSIEEWVGLFKDCGLTDVIAFQTNVSNDFPGTLVIKGK